MYVYVSWGPQATMEPAAPATLTCWPLLAVLADLNEFTATAFFNWAVSAADLRHGSLGPPAPAFLYQANEVLTTIVSTTLRDEPDHLSGTPRMLELTTSTEVLLAWMDLADAQIQQVLGSCGIRAACTRKLDRLAAAQTVHAAYAAMWLEHVEVDTVFGGCEAVPRLPLQITQDLLLVCLDGPALMHAAAGTEHPRRIDLAERRRCWSAPAAETVCLAGKLVRFRAPFLDGDKIPLYSPACILSVKVQSGKLRLRPLSTSVQALLRGRTIEVTPDSISNEPLSEGEWEVVLRTHGGPWHSRGPWGQHYSPKEVQAHGEALAAAAASAEPLVRLLRKRPRCTELEEYWFRLRGGMADHELVDDEGYSSFAKVGARSYSAWLAELLGGANLAVWRLALSSRSLLDREQMCRRFDSWPTAARGHARLLARRLLIDGHPEYGALVEYAELLANLTTEQNAMRDERGQLSAHRVFQTLMDPLAHELHGQGLVQAPSAADLKCPICFESMEDGFADGREWVWLRPCGHWLDETCAQKMLDAGRSECPLGCGKVLCWLVMGK